jgi:hypothetical protein
VRPKYERALRVVQDIVQDGGLSGPSAKTVETRRDGLSVKVHTRQVKSTVDGKTSDDPAQPPPEVRARVE